MSATNNIAPGTRLGPYTLVEPLGSGAHATVYLAHDANGRAFAVKVRRRGDADMDRRFLREFESMRLLRVAGVVPVYQAGIDGELLWFSMDRVFGKSFHDDLEREGDLALRVDRAVRLSLQLCTVLASLHDAGFVHRDVKPSNVLVDASGQVHVLDFGIGRYFGDQDTLSNTGEVLGTIPFMAPELLAGLPSDEKVDLFAAGLMIYEAIGGRRKRPQTTVGWIPKICLERLRPLASRFREVPRGLSFLLEAMTAVDPRDRPTSREAARELQRVLNREVSPEWPTPPFVDPGPWWTPLEGCIGHTEHPPVWILDGPTGSGRSRIAEQLHRVALLQGTWTLHLRCRVDRVGGPLLELLEELIAHLDDARLAKVVGDAAPALRQIWPHLPLPLSDTPNDPLSASLIVEAIARAIDRASELRPMLLVIHDLERIDRLTARALPRIGAMAGENLGVLLLQDIRWATDVSRQVVATLQRRANAQILTIPRFFPEVVDQLTQSLCPEGAPTFGRPTTPRAAVEGAWHALAAWRGETFAPPSGQVWPLTVRDAPIPTRVFERCVGSDIQVSPWMRISDAGVALSGPSAHLLARSRLGNLARTAQALAATWEAEIEAQEEEIPGDLATLWLVAGEMDRAWVPAARAAIAADRLDLFSTARQWLLLLETLAPPAELDPDLKFELAHVRARTALYVDSLSGHAAVIQLAEERARTSDQRHRTRVLRAEMGLRHRDVRGALVKALRVSSPHAGAQADVALRALVVALRCRIALGQGDEAGRELERAEALLQDSVDPIAPIRIRDVRAQLAFFHDDLLWCRALCQETIRAASGLRHVRGVALAAHRLGRVLRMLGRRREAEQQIRSAREAFAATGDLSLDAEAGLALVALLAERGDALPAHHLLDGTIRRIRGLAMGHLMPTAMRLLLQVATLTGDLAQGRFALDHLDPDADPETAAVLVRWWRSQGDLERALAIEGNLSDPTFGSVLFQLERSRSALSAEQPASAEADARAARVRAESMGFTELDLYARLLLGCLDDGDETSWIELQREATGSMFTEVFLGALEMDARRLHHQDRAEAGARWRSLLARAQEMGYRPGVSEATDWLHDHGGDP